jgi:hypothetical protein
VHSYISGTLTTAQAVVEMRRVGVRVTQAFFKRAQSAQSFGDDIPHFSECKNSRGKSLSLSKSYTHELKNGQALHYIQGGIHLSQASILTMTRTFYRDEHDVNPSLNTLGSSWFHRFIDKCGIDTSLYNPIDMLRANSATEHNVRNFFDHVARTAVKYGFAVRNSTST